MKIETSWAWAGKDESGKDKHTHYVNIEELTKEQRDKIVAFSLTLDNEN